MLTRCLLAVFALAPIALVLLLFLVSHGSPHFVLRRATSVPNDRSHDGCQRCQT
jgi:hypothetical protein